MPSNIGLYEWYNSYTEVHREFTEFHGEELKSFLSLIK
jgi:hypothetical protein